MFVWSAVSQRFEAHICFVHTGSPIHFGMYFAYQKVKVRSRSQYQNHSQSATLTTLLLTVYSSRQSAVLRRAWAAQVSMLFYDEAEPIEDETDGMLTTETTTSINPPIPTSSISVESSTSASLNRRRRLRATDQGHTGSATAKVKRSYRKLQESDSCTVNVRSKYEVCTTLRFPVFWGVINTKESRTIIEEGNN